MPYYFLILARPSARTWNGRLYAVFTVPCSLIKAFSGQQWYTTANLQDSAISNRHLWYQALNNVETALTEDDFPLETVLCGLVKSSIGRVYVLTQMLVG